ncbi:MAG: CCA tRNA nucleotidyltransferase [Clostridia bacterium]|nr:CCA tRNA nucleotidyltransferase [Clostridia bacterium]
MFDRIAKSLILLAQSLPKPLYVVGGAVRDHLIGFQEKTTDWDICSPMLAEEFAAIATAHGFTINAVYRNTGTVKLRDYENNEFEFSSFRSDEYVRGVHTPVNVFFTDDVTLDARRRDFTCNAVYYDVAAQKYVDPLDGSSAIKEKRLSTVAPAKKVFGEDGLRLMRLARQAGQLGFTPDQDCLNGARENAALIDDISAERIYTELLAILSADEKHGLVGGAYRGLRLLDDIGVFERIFPELALGKGMKQRADFHKYDVLEHTLRSVKYAAPQVRLAALLHDVGKPYCMQRDGKYHAHPIEGERITHEILTRLKAPKKTVAHVGELVKWHMYDLDCKTSENKLRRFFVQHHTLLDDLLLLKQADFSACMDDLDQAPTCVRWRALLSTMQKENVPFSLKALAVNGNDLLTLGIAPHHIAAVLSRLLLHVSTSPQDNQKERLLRFAVGFDHDVNH